MQNGFPSDSSKFSARIRSLDWSDHPLGPPKEWPTALRISTGIVMNAAQPMFIIWGQHQSTIYNKYYAELLGQKHPEVFGKPYSEIQPALQTQMAETIEQVYSGHSAKIDRIHLIKNELTRPEETYFDFSFTPIVSENDDISGILGTGIDVTKDAISERRHEALQKVAIQLMQMAAPEKILTSAADELKNYQQDLPFTLFYKTNPTGRVAELVSATGLKKGSALYQERIKPEKEMMQWPIQKVIKHEEAILFQDLETKFGQFSCASYSKNPNSAMLLPVYISDQTESNYVMVAGISAYLRLDKAYESFLEQLRVTICSSMQRSKAKEAYNLGENIFYSFVNNTAVGIARVSKEGEITFANNRLCEILSVANDKLIGQNARRYLYPEDYEEITPLIKKFYANGIPFSFEKRLIRPDAALWVYTSVTPIFDKEGNVIAASVASIDISRQKSVEDSLRKSKSQLAAIFSKASVGISESSVNGKFLRVNKELCKMFGRSREELLTMRATDITHPEDLEMTLQAYQQILKKGSQVSLEKRYLLPDGSFIHGHSTLTYLRKSQYRRESVLAVTVDISRQKRHEANVQLITSLNSELATLTDPEEIMQVAGDKLNTYFKTSNVSFATIDRSAKTATIIYENSKELDLSVAGTHHLKDYMDKAYRNKLRNGQILAVANVEENPLTASKADAYKALRIKSHIHSPYLRNGEWKFLISMLHKTPYQWREDEIELIRDLTGRIYLKLERAYAEKALKESEKRYKMLFNSIDEGFCLIEAIFDKDQKPVDYRFLETNPAFEKQTGLKNATGKRMKELTPEHEDYWCKIYAKVTKRGKPIRFENRATELMGGWYDVYAFPFGDSDSNLVGILFNDITKRKENEAGLRRSEEHLQRIMESAKDFAIFTMDKNRRIESWNAGAENLFGYTANEIKGKHGDILFVPRDRDWAPKKEVNAALGSGNAEDERWHIHKDGSRFWGSGLMMPLLDEKGNPKGFLKIMRDNTEQRDMQKALHQAKQREIELIKAENLRKDEFMSIASHELKTPLTSLQAYIQLMIENIRSLDQATIHNYLSKIEKSSQRMANLVIELLDATRIKSGQIRYNFAYFEFGKMVEESIEMTQLYTKNHTIELQQNIDLTVYGDRDRLQQVVNNLLTNAIKYSPDGGIINVEISAPDNQVKLTVTDPGLGIPEDKLEVIFQSYSRVDTGHHISGMGLGLYIAAEVINRHKGRIWAESRHGKGSSFHFTIPRGVAYPL